MTQDELIGYFNFVDGTRQSSYLDGKAGVAYLPAAP
jgi:hypothetical protein